MVTPGAPEAAYIQTLIDACLLQVDDQGRVYDEVLTRARDDAIEQAQAKRSAANKRWNKAGTPREDQEGTDDSRPPFTPADGDF